MIKTFTLPEYGYEVELGKFARQADGAVWLKQGGTVVLATVVSAASKDFPGFLPLTTDYREQFAAAGKIPGGYFKREGRSTDKEILISRLIDRAIRPLFPVDYFNQIQVLVTVYSVDQKHSPVGMAMVAASLALSTSKIPFLGPVGLAEVGRIDGKWVVNPLFTDMQNSDVKLTVAGTEEGICMVEGSCAEISEQELVDLLFMAHAEIKKQVAWQAKIQEEVGLPKEAIDNKHLNWNLWTELVEEFLTIDNIKTVYVADKVQRSEQLKALRVAFAEKYADKIAEFGTVEKVLDYIFDVTLQDKMSEHIFAVNKRIDGRSYDQIRDITTEVGLLPFTHGSAFFQRGRTQALVSVTLGSGQDEQRIEGIMEDASIDGSFMLHYNFPPFSVGEVRPLRGPGRREVGHGYLALSAIRQVLPSKEDFPYTIRIVADMLESDGSTSMATTCGSTLALMHAGVPITNMISGIAMGLLKSKDGRFAVLSDISGFEDAFGLMDFKITGNDNGITAVQMDIKYKGGLTRDVFESALEQARKGRAHILGEMRKTISQPNKELSILVPKMITVQIDREKIGAVIGGGGKIIREIIENTGTTIDIGDDGLVKIFGGPEADIQKAISWVKTLAGQIDKGAVYQGKIRRFADFGIFVELVPGLDGLVHVSAISREKQRTFMSEYKIDDTLPVEVVEYDKESGRVRLKLVE